MYKCNEFTYALSTPHICLIIMQMMAIVLYIFGNENIKIYSTFIQIVIAACGFCLFIHEHGAQVQNLLLQHWQTIRA